MVKEKRCPKCNRVYFDETLNYCLADGSFLYFLEELAEQPTNAETELLNVPPETEEVFVKPTDAPTEILEVPTEIRKLPTDAEKSIETRVISKTRPSFDPAPETTPVRIANPARKFVIIGTVAIFALIILAAVVYSGFTIFGGGTRSKNEIAANNLPIVNLPIPTTPTPTSTPQSALAGTAWAGTSPRGSYKMIFAELGFMSFAENDGKFNANMASEWRLDGDTVTIDFKRIAIWEGALKGDQIIFNVRQENGDKWTTTATRIPYPF